MQINVVVDVVIGLVVLFWIVATSASFVVEALSSFLNIRGKMLEHFVREMLLGTDAMKVARWTLSWFPRRALDERPDCTAAPDANAEHTSLEIADHPLIRRLAKPPAFIRFDDTPPSYIPSDLFAKALVDRIRQIYGGLLAAADVVTVLGERLPEHLRSQVGPWLHSPLSIERGRDPRLALKEMLEKVAAAEGATQILGAAVSAERRGTGVTATVLAIVAARLQTSAQRDRAREDPGAFVRESWAEVESTLSQRTLSVSDLQTIVASGRLPAPLAAALRPLLDAANHDIESFMKGLGSWYDSVMDRATGWFRRHIQWWLGAVALAIAVCLNLDAIYIGHRLVADRELRDAAVRVGQTIVTQGDVASSLPQVYTFKERFKDGGWAHGLLGGPDALSSGDALARQVQPLLLTSGRYVEPMMALQAAALQMTARCLRRPADRACSDDEFVSDWKDQESTREALVAALCRVSIDGQKASQVDRDWAAHSSDKDLLADIGRDQSRKRCAMQATWVPADAASTQEVLDKLWSDGKVTWNAELTRAAWAVRRVKAGGNGDAILVVKDFVVAMDAAIDEARKQVKVADELLARLEYVGSFSKAVERWALPASGALVPLWSIVGWLITAFMSSLGAPMWFDLLNKLINRRITGPKPEAGTSPGTTG